MLILVDRGAQMALPCHTEGCRSEWQLASISLRSACASQICAELHSVHAHGMLMLSVQVCSISAALACAMKAG